MIRHLARLLGLQPDQMGRLLLLWTVGLLFSAALQIGDGVTQTLFLKRIGVEYLPVMFAMKAALDILVAAIYVPLAARRPHASMLSVMLGLCAVGLVLIWVPAHAGLPWAYPSLYAFTESMATVLKIHWGVLLLGCFSDADARRTFPAVYTGARAGAMLGGVLLTLLVRWLSPADLLPVGAALLLGAMGLSPAARRFQIRDTSRPVGHLRQGLTLGIHVPLLRAIAVATVLMVICRYALRYRYSSIFATSFAEAELAAFYGMYTAAANAASIVIQLVITARLLVHAGVTRTNLLYAAAILAAFAGLSLWSSLSIAILARLVDNELKAAIKTPLSNLFYGALPAAQQGPGRAFILGLVVPLATACASLLLTRPETLRLIPLWGVVLATLYLGATWVQNRRYRRACVED